MKLKSLLALTALAAATAAMANSVQSDGTLCRIEIQSATTNTIVSIPLVKVASADTETTIPLTNLVLTTNLDNGDYILHQVTVSSSWESWIIEDGKWKGAAVSDAGVTTKTGDAASFGLGDAFWLVRKDPIKDGAAKSFYLYGQVAAAAGTMTTIPADRTADTFIMMGNTNLADVAVGSIVFQGTKLAGDKLDVPTANVGFEMTEYTYMDGVWKKPTFAMVSGRLEATMSPVGEGDKIPAGQGFWYVAKKSASSGN